MVTIIKKKFFYNTLTFVIATSQILNCFPNFVLANESTNSAIAIAESNSSNFNLPESNLTSSSALTYQIADLTLDYNEQYKNKSQNKGFLAYFYYDDNFRDLAFMTFNANQGAHFNTNAAGGLNSSDKILKSAEWIGQIKIDSSDKYTFSSTDNNTTIKIEENPVFYNGTSTEIDLTPGLYEVRIEYQSNNLRDNTLGFVVSSENSNRIKSAPQMFPPELNPNNRRSPLILNRENSLGDSTFIGGVDEHTDTDSDGIKDLWEMNGYAVVNHVPEPWTEEHGKLGYVKYVSNPNHAHTARDPYTDLEKAIGDIDEATLEVAMDPLVAAVPAISVGMERMILSRVINQNWDYGHSMSAETSSSSTTSITEGYDANVGLSTSHGISISVSGHYSNTSSQTVEQSNSLGQNWTSGISLNQGETADLNANIRYYNTGTGVIYNAVPTVNFVLDNDTLATVTTQINQMTNFLKPNESYPPRHLNALALNTLDQFSSRLIPLNYQQVKKLDQGKKLTLQTTQFSGDFVKRSYDGGNIIAGKWDYFIPQIEETTTAITLDLGNGEAIERRIAAKNPKNVNDRTPELTLKEAIIKGFAAEEDNNGNLYYYDQITNKKILLDEKLFHFVVDSYTINEIDNQMKQNNLKSLFDVIIRQKMNIYMLLPMYSADASQNNIKLTNIDKININGETVFLYKSDIDYKPKTGSLNSISNLKQPNTLYLITFDAKPMRQNQDTFINLLIGRNENYNLIGETVSILKGNEFTSYSIPVITGDKVLSNDDLIFTIARKSYPSENFYNDAGIYFKNLRIYKIKTTID